MFPSGLQSGSYMKAAAGNSRFIDSLLISMLSFKPASAPVIIRPLRINREDVNPRSLLFDVWFRGHF